MTSTGALSLDKVPEKMIVIGGGVIGLELVRNMLIAISSCHCKNEHTYCYLFNRDPCGADWDLRLLSLSTCRLSVLGWTQS